jgi:multimeric flavodoxin WrbA
VSPRLLVVHHSVSPATAAVLAALLEGARDPLIRGVDVVTRPALSASAVDLLEASACLVFGPVNLGYLAGAVKHFFDQVFYPCLEDTRGLPWAGVLHAGGDATGALRALQSITTGLSWRAVASPLVVQGAAPADLDRAREVAAVLAATIAPS